jgi:hypothetical protein
LTEEPLHISRPIGPGQTSSSVVHRFPCGSRWPTNGEADTLIIGVSLEGQICKRSSIEMDQTARISLQRMYLFKEQRANSNPSRLTLSATSCPDPRFFRPRSSCPLPVKG